MALLELTRPDLPTLREENRGPLWIDSHSLALGFANYNRALGVPEATQDQVDRYLWQLGEVDARTADHCRRTGGYAGTIIRCLGGSAFHEGLVRVSGALHDIGKQHTDSVTLHRTWGDVGWGAFDRAGIDMANIHPHPAIGFDMLKDDPLLPPEAKFVAGCHHQYEAEPYGIPLSEIDREYDHDPAMAAWVHMAVRVVAAADIFEAATNRTGNSYNHGGSRLDYFHRRFDRLQLGDPDAIIDALQQEQHYYVLPAAQLAA